MHSGERRQKQGWGGEGSGLFASLEHQNLVAVALSPSGRKCIHVNI